MSALEATEKLLVIIGPSASGKSSTVKTLVSRNVIKVTPSWTTRPMRDDDIDSVEHVFVSEDEFLAMQNNGRFLRTVQLFNLPYHYGLPSVSRPPHGVVPTVMLRAPLVKMVTKFYPRVTVYQIADTKEKVAARLAIRTAAGEQQGSRLDDYDRELELGRTIASRNFINRGSLDVLADEITSALSKDFT